jgi:Arc/MetJ-type ribon-helix-helix transcriptional regulator
MATVTVKLPDGLAARLKAAVKKRGRSQSEVLREALEAHLERENEALGDTCLELAADLAGCLDGPSDLSSNRRHLRGYGR